MDLLQLARVVMAGLQQQPQGGQAGRGGIPGLDGGRSSSLIEGVLEILAGAAAGQPGAPGTSRPVGGAAAAAPGGPAAPGGAGGLGGLGDLQRQFEQAGLGDLIASWIGNGSNLPISADQLSRVLGPEILGRLGGRAGLGADQAPSILAQLLPEVVNQLTPQGRPPAGDDLTSMMSEILGKPTR